MSYAINFLYDKSFAFNFLYDGLYLSDFGFIICEFGGSSGTDIVSAGSKITFNTVSQHLGKKYSSTGIKYEECIQATINICKDPRLNNDLEISKDEYNDLMRWLNRHKFLKFQLLNAENDNYCPCYYEASFNIDKVKVDEVLIGLELSMETNRPFGYGQLYGVSWNITDTSKPYIFRDISDEIGYIYPDLKITINTDGEFRLYNEFEGCSMVIKNCKAGEVITIDGTNQIINSSLDSHKVYDDFNYDYFRIGNTLNCRNNKIYCSLPCKLEIKYNPIIKDSP